ncbi:hypothetical protein AJ79_02829 [Helicocarpus griseus UAMH5409]|uniref:Signal recognition particle receptor subunit beta n=1 Tax=Helicocarpus griseus UAMH5409 TaxID=1447875 RepID=A0A2B7Y198_9EURO|nr:hypothetical protein AJ79_02829 [Helicocarpus griseus UAMH5409]
MDWTLSEIATALLSGNLIAILITFTVALSLPILLHIAFYRAAPANASKDFLLLGPSGSGKTALCSLLEQRSISHSQKPPRETHTSQVSSLVPVTLPASISIGSNKYRSVNDPSLKETAKNPTTYRMRDTPGHGKLRVSQGIAWLSSLSDPKRKKGAVGVRGVIFMLDSASLSQSDELLRDAATYLHDVLMTLQNRVYKNGVRTPSSRNLPSIPVLIAANKQDLFTALPPGSVKSKLESEIEKIRQSKRKGLLDVSMNALSAEEEQDMLGGDEEEEPFTFKMLAEHMGIKVDVLGGAVVSGDDDADSGIRRWEEWVGMCL